jgi:hypothetical protein
MVLWYQVRNNLSTTRSNEKTAKNSIALYSLIMTDFIEDIKEIAESRKPKYVKCYDMSGL